jgi:FG-GAP-like repeat/Bacterial Ig-like domain/FlgD Ig-like domain
MRATSRIVCVSLCLVLFTAAAHATTHVLSVEPQPQRIDVPANAAIQVTFDQPIDDTLSVNAISFRVFGRWSGPASGNRTVNGNIMTFTPNQPFFAGEWVTVNVSRNITSTSGETLAQGYAWNFWIKSKPASLNLQYAGRITTRLATESTAPYGGYAGDLNDDGASDLTVPCEHTGDARIFMNDGTGTFSTFRVETLVPNSESSPNEGADFNNDGEIDIVFGDSNGTLISVLLGDGTGQFFSKTFHTAGSSIRGVGVADLNGDGWDDIVTANLSTNNLSIFMNNGDGTFPDTGTPKEAGGNGEVSIAIADANNDGLLDVFCGTYNSPYQVIVLLSDGNGGLVPQPPVPAGGHPWLQITVGDFNGDGNVDTAIDHVFGNSVGVLMGNGLGGLSAVQSYPTGENPYAIDTADIDGDGDLELVTSNFGTADWTIYENAGGVFVNPRTLSSDRSGSCAVLHDRDMDGDIDLTGFDEIHDWIYFYENVTNPSGVKPPTATAMLEQNHPNPFNPTTSIRFELSSEADVTLAVYDAAGAFVTRIAVGHYAAGPHEVRWNGTDARGARVASGVYFYRLFSGDIDLKRKMVLLK